MEIRSFADFWPFYVRAHSRPRTRILHALGSTAALVCVLLGFAVSAWFFLAAPLVGYAFAWYGHFFVEHNKPATFGHPFYSLAADYVMVWKMMTGRMNEEVRRHAAMLLFVALLAIPLAAQEPAPAAYDPWTSSIGAGLALTSGNTDTKNINVSFTTRYDPKTRMVFKSEALYLRGDSNGETLVDKATASARDEYSLSPRTFAFAEVSYLRDPFKGISYLVAPVAGAGYRVLKSDVRNLTVDAAAGVQTERDEGFGRSTSGAVKAGEDFDWAISRYSKITQKLTALWKTDDFSDALYHFDTGLTTTVATRVELKVAYAYDYKNQPLAIDAKKGDSALFAAVLFKF